MEPNEWVVQRGGVCAARATQKQNTAEQKKTEKNEKRERESE